MLMNHLKGEKSRYLKQHADNPVDWYPWCDETFEKARSEDKPIFLSIGYSSCHWCHVMAHESFEDEEVAELMNRTFVSIKVDKEERPDVDKVYMKVARAMSGKGGWPLNIVMTPDKKPFYSATYIPKEGKKNRLGLKGLSNRVRYMWDNDREKLLSTGNKVISTLREKEIRHAEKIDISTLNDGYEVLKTSFDSKFGGFGNAPKFPSPHNLIFLIDHWKRTGDNKALEMVKKTLENMRMGGIYDHIGYGFHRYSTDRRWKLPHFEKMLYDQAMLIIAYSEAYNATKDDMYRKTAEETIEYVLRELKSKSGGFYSSEDADVGGIEGGYYIWSKDEIEKLLGKNADRFNEVYNVNSEGNYYEESTGEKTGKNVLYMSKKIEDWSEEYEMDEEKLRDELARIREILFEEREKREKPGMDKKILTDWNSLMITSLARAGRIFEDQKIIGEAEKGLEFVLDKLSDDAQLKHRYIEGDVDINGMLDDYAYMVWALIEMYESCGEDGYLKKAIEYAKTMIEKFWDEEHGGFYFSESKDLPLKEKEVYDGAYPSGNSIALFDLVYLYEIKDDQRYKEKAEMMIDYFSGPVRSSPGQYTMFLRSAEYLLSQEKVINK